MSPTSLISDPVTCRHLTLTIAKRLQGAHGGNFEMAECMGWAQLGLTRAATMFRPSKFTGRTEDPMKRISAYLLAKGRLLAVDEMRAAGMVGRRRRGRYYPPTSIPATAEPQANVKDHRTPDPTEPASAKDFIAAVLSCPQLTPTEKMLLRSVYVDGRTISEVAATRKVVRRVMYACHESALRKVRTFLN